MNVLTHGPNFLQLEMNGLISAGRKSVELSNSIDSAQFHNFTLLHSSIHLDNICMLDAAISNIPKKVDVSNHEGTISFGIVSSKFH